ncbi:unnamed protein product [Commensalibacter communis]|uniref:Ankyrin repeat protein n=1 Tax=Commensalibacter communis TaxID=2972786 RepID=A0A9W4TL71_9PROT|nr:hypothetical protein [Commensalibacter communis]CAI3923721.1 unnamed protein product [Commensalibacter communis]CAI3925201.1 unnamed protein product [Commensalibacter communis]CAI3937234.1 unnamed protein product [Commensalibacter communis]CAI3937795.1 unnamed protein product [Commensalibacter communis]
MSRIDFNATENSIMNSQARLLPFFSSLLGSAYMVMLLSSVSAHAQTVTGHPHSQKNTQHQPKHPQPQASDDDDQDDNANPGEKDKNPTQLLFDAINTGNLRQAQEALSRGADMHAANILGQTPLEMSVDLNRDRITFLLLSMRGYNNSPQQLTSVSTEASSVTVKDGKARMSVKGKNKRGTINASNGSAYSEQNSGTPKPEIGFLGFQNR